jgi:hypothetical protein
MYTRFSAVHGFLTEDGVRYRRCKYTVTKFVGAYYYNVSQASPANKGQYSSMSTFLGGKQRFT